MVLTGILAGGNVSVQSGGALNISGGSLTAATTTVSAGGSLIDDGALTTALTNNGTVFANTGSVVTVTGSIINNGTVIVTNGTAFDSSGTFTNNGILDIMTGWPDLPPRFVNNGTVLTSSVVKVKGVTFTGTGGMTIVIQTYTGHTYQLQSESSLKSTWANVTGNVTTQTDGNGVMTFTLSNVTGNSLFYRIQVE
jgi:formylmethanofuran dehydrogenase subunit C